MTTLRNFCADLMPALCLSTLIEGALIATFLAGVLVAFALAVSP